MTNGIVTAEDLATATGYKRPADIERCLRAQGIRYFAGKDGPWMTLAMLDAAGGIKHSSNDGMYEGNILG